MVQGLLSYRVFKLHDGGPEVEEICAGEGDEAVEAASHWILPCTGIYMTYKLINIRI